SPSAGSTRSNTRWSSTATTCRGRRWHEPSGARERTAAGRVSRPAESEPSSRHRERTSMSVPTDLVVSGPHALRGRLRVPGDKGMSHRALLFAAMADGRSRVVGLAGGDDVFRTRHALAQLGVTSTIAGSAIIVDGRGVDALTEPAGIVDCGNSGTTIRLLSGLLAGRPFPSVLTGD